MTLPTQTSAVSIVTTGGVGPVIIKLGQIATSKQILATPVI